jgi:hypothetical protein
MAEELTVSRGDDDPREALRAGSEARLEAALDQVDTEMELQLGQAPPFQGSWNIWAFGPWQWYNQQPSRIIMVNEWALLHTVVWMDPVIMGPNIVAHGDKIELEYFTGNMQTMTPAGAPLNHHVCIDTQATPIIRPSGYYFQHRWWFRPSEAACLYQMNICARICNCRNQPVREYAAFVRYVWDYDAEEILPLVRPAESRPAGWSFDHPIRFAVFDKSECDCS